MYERFYGLHQRPFSKTPDPAFLFEGHQHAEALARLLTAVEDREIALLTGEVGAGKTTLSRALIDQLDEHFRVVLIINPRLSASQMLNLIAERLGLDDVPKAKHKLIDALMARLFELYEAGVTPLVIVDEAQLITSRSVFEELRLLTNLALDDVPLIGLLLIGQPELRQKLAHISYHSFAQRVGMAFHLGPLDRSDVDAYVHHRLRVAGCDRRVFTEEAIEVLFQGTQGVPRRINTLCQGALLVGFGNGAEMIDADIVQNVLDDLQLHLGPVFHPPTTTTLPRMGRIAEPAPVSVQNKREESA
ncbi:MAG: AAA family ATPase [Deltaproteobacteria bacterium]|nr:AAA family ATPase [Deltaproteobacteria bacterium]